MLPSRTCRSGAARLRLALQFQPAHANVPNDADDRRSRRAKSIRGHGIDARQVPFDEGFADDRDAVRLEGVGLADVAAGLERNAQRFEEARGHEPENRARVRCQNRRPGLARRGLDVPDASTHDHGQEADIGGARHAGQRPDVGQDARVKIDAARRRTVFRDRQRRLHRDCVRRIEARLDRLDAPQRPDEQTGRHQENERRGYFRGDEDRSQPLGTAARPPRDPSRSPERSRSLATRMAGTTQTRSRLRRSRSRRTPGRAGRRRSPHRRAAWQGPAARAAAPRRWRPRYPVVHRRPTAKDFPSTAGARAARVPRPSRSASPVLRRSEPAREAGWPGSCTR